MLIAGAAVYITGWEYAPYFYLVGSLMFAAGQFVLVFLFGTFTQLLLQGADLTLLDHAFYKAVVTRHKYDKQEQRKHNPVFVLGQKHFELRQESVVHITLSVLQK